jgi:hypothetical protein
MTDVGFILEPIGIWLRQFEPGDWIAILALFVSVFAIRQTHTASKSIARLNALQIAQAEVDAVSVKSANVSADFVRSGKAYHLKIYNRGPNVALHVIGEILRGAELLVEGELVGKLPVLHMEPHAGTYLIAAPHMGSPPKLIIKLTWDDDNKKGNEKTLELAW